jgi:hypothetical protein
MGRVAMQILDRELHDHGGSSDVKVKPALMTRENVDSAEMRQIENMSWWSPQ